MMKKTVLLLLPFLFGNLAFGQTIEESIKNAEKLYKQNNFKEAIQNLENAKKEIEQSYLLEIKTALLPSIIEGYNPKDYDMQEFSKSFVSGNNIQITKSYSKAGKKAEQENTVENLEYQSFITITISNLPEKTCEILNILSQSSGNTMYEGSSMIPINFKEYRALKYYNKEVKQGKFAAIIGGAVLEIIAEGIESEKALIDVANKINTETIIKYFGK